MPIYEFQCNKCNHVFEKFTTNRSIKTTVCKQCGDSGANKIMSSTSPPVFNGTGFYETDYKNH